MAERDREAAPDAVPAKTEGEEDFSPERIAGIGTDTTGSAPARGIRKEAAGRGAVGRDLYKYALQRGSELGRPGA